MPILFPMHTPELPDDDASLGSSIELAPGVRVAGDVVSLSYSRSAGPGGQNVNKLSTRCEMRIALSRIPIRDSARARLAIAAGRRMTDAGELQIVSQNERSQSANRAECFAKLRELLIAAIVEPKVRRKTKPTRGSKERRLSAKKGRSEIKRKRSGGED